MYKPQRKHTEQPMKKRTESAQRSYERYINLAREAASRGDEVGMENFYQHAEHFYRAISQVRN